MDGRDEVVRRSIVRICFKWQNPAKKKEKLTAVLCGVIVSIKDDGSCLVIANPSLFRHEERSVVLNLPIPEGYDAVPVAPSTRILDRDFSALVLHVGGNDYVRPVTFETGGVQTSDRVSVFTFPNKDFFTPTAYNPGHIRYGDEWASFKFEAVFDSYGYLGAPIFNGVGHLVGISYDDGDAWSVSLIQDVLFRGAEIRSLLGSVSYVLKGNPIPIDRVPISA